MIYGGLKRSSDEACEKKSALLLTSVLLKAGTYVGIGAVKKIKAIE
jgi:hypothetical protein